MSYAYANHGDFGLAQMSGPDAVLWSVLGILLGIVVAYIVAVRKRGKDE